jgi:hypothetical protein
MKFRYLGDKKDMKAFGYDFSKGATPDVTDENAVKRLSGNNTFETVKEEPVKYSPKSGADLAPKAAVQNEPAKP